MAAIKPLELPLAAEMLTFWKSLPFELVLAGHCLFCAGLAPDFKGQWLVHYVVRWVRALLCPMISPSYAASIWSHGMHML